MLNTTDDADGSDGVKRMRLEDTNRTFELLALGGVWSSYGFFYLEEMEWINDRARIQVRTKPNQHGQRNLAAEIRTRGRNNADFTIVLPMDAVHPSNLEASKCDCEAQFANVWWDHDPWQDHGPWRTDSRDGSQMMLHAGDGRLSELTGQTFREGDISLVYAADPEDEEKTYCFLRKLIVDEANDAEPEEYMEDAD